MPTNKLKNQGNVEIDEVYIENLLGGFGGKDDENKFC